VDLYLPDFVFTGGIMSHFSSHHTSSKVAVMIWLFLVVASISIGWLADHHGVFAQWTVPIVVLIAAIKARAIILYFMEVKHAPWKLRLIFEVWVVVCACLIVCFWWFQGGGSW
jgi:hypothetical protein